MEAEETAGELGGWGFGAFGGCGGGGDFFSAEYGVGQIYDPYAGLSPGMRDSVAAFDRRVQNSFDANAANAALQNGDIAAANAIAANNPTISFEPHQDLRQTSGMTYQAAVDLYLKEYGVWDQISQQMGMTWTGNGYQFQFTHPDQARQFLSNNPNFASGILGAAHNQDVGAPNSDYRSWGQWWAPYSLQVTAGPSGVWADIDRFNPYHVLGFIQHAMFEYLPFWKRTWPWP